MKKKDQCSISLEDLGMAYRKAKVDRYYIGNSSLLDVLEYEENIEQNLKLLRSDFLMAALKYWATKNFLVHGR